MTQKKPEELTDEEIAAAIADDPDAAPLLDEEWFKAADLVVPNSPTPKGK